jgi:hypothetical protein
MSSVKEDLELFEMCLDNYEPPELIVRGHVSPEEVCQLFEMYEDLLSLACAASPKPTDKCSREQLLQQNERCKDP